MGKKKGGAKATKLANTNSLLDKVRKIVNSSDAVPSTEPAAVPLATFSQPATLARRESASSFGSKPSMRSIPLSSHGKTAIHTPSAGGIDERFVLDQFDVGAASGLGRVLKDFASRLIMMFEVSVESGNSYGSSFDAVILTQDSEHTYELRGLGYLFQYVYHQLAAAEKKLLSASGSRTDGLSVTKQDIVKNKTIESVYTSLEQCNQHLTDLVKLKRETVAKLAAVGGTLPLSLSRKSSEFFSASMSSLDEITYERARNLEDVDATDGIESLRNRLKQLAFADQLNTTSFSRGGRPPSGASSQLGTAPTSPRNALTADGGGSGSDGRNSAVASVPGGQPSLATIVPQPPQTETMPDSPQPRAQTARVRRHHLGGLATMGELKAATPREVVIGLPEKRNISTPSQIRKRHRFPTGEETPEELMQLRMQNNPPSHLSICRAVADGTDLVAILGKPHSPRRIKYKPPPVPMSSVAAKELEEYGSYLDAIRDEVMLITAGEDDGHDAAEHTQGPQDGEDRPTYSDQLTAPPLGRLEGKRKTIAPGEVISALDP